MDILQPSDPSPAPENSPAQHFASCLSFHVLTSRPRSFDAHPAPGAEEEEEERLRQPPGTERMS